MINVRIPHEVKNAMLKAADDDHGRSMSGMVVRVLSEWLAEHGYLKIKPTTAPKKAR